MEPAISFRHAALKIKWAGVLLDNLDKNIEHWLDSEPYAFSIHQKEKGAGQFLNAGLSGIPYTIPCFAGDICHNLRAALDYCWMGLVRASAPSGVNPTKQTLPFADNRKGLEATVRKSSVTATFPEAEALLTEKIRSHHDHAGGGQRFLSALNAANNWQKHNMLAIIATVTRFDGVSLKDSRGSSVFIESLNVENSVAPIAGFGGEIIEFRYDGKPTIEIWLHGEHLMDREPLIPTLINFRQTVVKCFKAFVETFDPTDAADIAPIVEAF